MPLFVRVRDVAGILCVLAPSPLSLSLSRLITDFRIDMADVCISHRTNRTQILYTHTVVANEHVNISDAMNCIEPNGAELSARAHTHTHWLSDHLKLPIIRNEYYFHICQIRSAHHTHTHTYTNMNVCNLDMRERATQWKIIERSSKKKLRSCMHLNHMQ